jgi:hypothetical protein
MTSRYADLSTDELDRLIALEERRMDRERGVTKQKERCAAPCPLPCPARLTAISWPADR